LLLKLKKTTVDPKPIQDYKEAICSRIKKVARVLLQEAHVSPFPTVLHLETEKQSTQRLMDPIFEDCYASMTCNCTGIPTTLPTIFKTFLPTKLRIPVNCGIEPANCTVVKPLNNQGFSSSELEDHAQSLR
jgi:hypothetical protein